LTINVINYLLPLSQEARNPAIVLFPTGRTGPPKIKLEDCSSIVLVQRPKPMFRSWYRNMCGLSLQKRSRVRNNGSFFQFKVYNSFCLSFGLTVPIYFNHHTLQQQRGAYSKHYLWSWRLWKYDGVTTWYSTWFRSTELSNWKLLHIFFRDKTCTSNWTKYSIHLHVTVLPTLG